MDESMVLLAERMAAGGRTVAFVGAGASVRAGYPTWAKLVAELRTRAYGPMAPDDGLDLRAAAELYAEVLGERGVFEQELKQALLASGPRGAGEFHRKLARLPFAYYITTNYDRLVEEAVDAELAVAAESRNGGDAFVSPRDACRSLNGRNTADFNVFLGGLAQDDPRRSVLHLHGILDQEMTLTMGQYDDQYLNDAMQLRMFSIFATTTVVFIGASLFDPDVMELVRRSNYHGARRPRHFAFLPSGRRREEQMLKRTYGIRPIFYDEADDHRDLEHKLDHLLELCDRADGLGGGPDPCTGKHRTFWDPIIESSPRHTDEDGNLLGRAEKVDLTEAVEGVETEIRRTPRGGIAFGGLNATTASATLRHVARRYRELPNGSAFDRVIWLSPRRLGLFPPSGEPTPRNVRDVIFGAVTGSIGADRLTATLDHQANLGALGAALEEVRGQQGSRRALIVVEDAPTLVAWYAPGSDDDPDPVAEVAAALPDGSRAVYRAELPEGTAPADADCAAALPDAEGLADPQQSDMDRIIAADAFGAQILAALAISADPLGEDDLATMLDAPEANGHGSLANGEPASAWSAELEIIADRCVRLAKAGYVLRDPQLGTGRCAYTVTAPVRTLILAAAATQEGRAALTAAGAWMLRWAESVMSNARKWEIDHRQFERLTERLPVLVSIFSAGCWLGFAAEPAPEGDAHRVDRLLWLGRDVSRFLYTVGRWPEALQIAGYLVKHAGRSGDDGVLEREARLLIATILAHATADDDRRGTAIRHAEKVRAAAAEAASAWSAPANGSYPPARITPRRQESRAELRLAQIYSERRQFDQAEKLLDDLYRTLRRRLRRARRREDEDLQLLGDVAGYLAEERLRARRNGDAPADASRLRALLAVLDEGQLRLSELNNRRRLGHHARLRGDVMIDNGNRLAARRSYMEALLVAHEFKDRYLEGLAKLGLAQCDESRQLADQAVRVFEELNVEDERSRARQIRRDLPEREPGRPRVTPDVVAFIGAPGSGKRLARDVAIAALDRWGYKETVMRFDPSIDDQLRSGVEVAPARIHDEIVRHLDSAEKASDRVLLTKLSLWQHSYIEPFGVEGDLTGRMLVVSMVAPRRVLLRRNEQRFSGQLDTSVLESIDEDGRVAPPRSASTWRSWFEERGAAYVEIPTGSTAGVLDVPVHRLRSVIRQELEPSFVSPECLLRSRGLVAHEPCGGAVP